MVHTKQKVWKQGASIYGFQAPFIVRAELPIQLQTWIQTADWDLPLPDHF